MDLQLVLLPYHYYNTLGFDAELIDYIDHVDDDTQLLSNFRAKVSAENCFMPFFSISLRKR